MATKIQVWAQELERLRMQNTGKAFMQGHFAGGDVQIRLIGSELARIRRRVNSLTKTKKASIQAHKGK